MENLMVIIPSQSPLIGWIPDEHTRKRAGISCIINWHLLRFILANWPEVFMSPLDAWLEQQKEDLNALYDPGMTWKQQARAITIIEQLKKTLEHAKDEMFLSFEGNRSVNGKSIEEALFALAINPEEL